MTRFLEDDRLSFSYDKDSEVLSDVSFSINRGEIVSLVGANGSGKTNLIQNRT